MRAKKWLVRPMVLAVGGCFSAVPAWANPTGPQVVHGSVQMQGLGTNHLKVTNSPSSIIHWQGFSIGAGQITQFQQQSAASAVLNRVVGPDISSIQGSLLSNGQVFLINPAGIIVGPGGVIDTAGFVGSTLNMLNADFLSRKLRFEGGAGAGSIVNQGLIRAGQNGSVVLVAPGIENSGVVHSEGGEIILAAGQKATIGSLKLEGVQFEVQAPSDSVLNLGKLLADDGAVGVFAGTLKHSGDIRANALARDEAGRVVLKAQKDAILDGNSTISADSGAGKGGAIQILGDRVSLRDHAAMSASGTAGGGTILVGGDYQGRNPSVQNAARAFVGPHASLRADATQGGDGGRIIVWADDTTQFYGSLSARGGVSGGNGGFAEVSGKQNLIFAGSADLGAPKGASGTLLLDPLDLFISLIGGTITSIIDEATDVPNNAVTISPDALAAIAGNVVLHAGRYMLFRSPVNLTRPGQSLTATVDTWTPTEPAGAFANMLYIGADITTNGGAVSFTAPEIRTGGALPQTITTNGGAIALNATRGPISGPLDLNAGTGAVTAFAPKIPIPDTDPQQFDVFGVQLGNVTGGSFNVSIAGSINTGNIMTTGPVSLTSAEQSIFTSDINSGPGNVTLNAMMNVGTNNIATAGAGVFANSVENSVFTGDIMAGGGNVALMSRTGVFTNTVDTTGNVNLLATQGSIFSTVNNAASLTASATRTNGSSVTTSITQTAATPLNATSVTATASGCFNVFFNCAGANVNINAVGPVNVGTVMASAPVTLQNNTNAAVTINSAQGSIQPMSAASQVTGVDVTLTTGLLSGGGVGTAALPLNVDVTRNFTMTANGEFDVLFNVDSPNQLNIGVGVAPAGQMFAGNVRHGGNVLLNATATDNTVTLNSLPTTGFDEQVFNANPFIAFDVPNGNLNVPAVAVPEGATDGLDGVPGLDVQLSARDDITITSFTRTSSPESVPKFTSVISQMGSVNIGAFNPNLDDVFISGPAGITISPSSLMTGGSVALQSTTGTINTGTITSGGSVSADTTTGNIIVGEIDTTSGEGAVTLTISCVFNNSCAANPAVVGAAGDSAAFEIRTSLIDDGEIVPSISITGHTIGSAGFARPLDLQSRAITLTSRNTGGQIGFTGGNPVIADAPNLTIFATNPNVFTGTTGASFHVDTLATALQNLNVTATGMVNADNQVRSEGRTYSFTGDGTNFVFNPGAVPATQFMDGGLLSFTATQGNINTLTDINMGAGRLALHARSGDANANMVSFDGAALTMSAGTALHCAGRPCIVSIGDIGTTIAPDFVNLTSGASVGFGVAERPGTVTTGSIMAGNVTIRSHGEPGAGVPAIRVGADGAPKDVTATGVVSLEARRSGPFDGSASGSIEVNGNVTANSIFFQTFQNDSITAGDLAAATNLTLLSRGGVATGTLDGQNVRIERDNGSNAGAVTTGTIGAMTPVQTLEIRGSSSTVATNAVTTGAVTLDMTVANTVDLHGSGNQGQVVIGTSGTTDSLVGGDGSTVRITSSGPNPFGFSRIDAGDTGTVNINSTAGIQQTADGGVDGITARMITLTTGTSAAGTPRAIDNTGDPVLGLDLRNATENINLTISSGGPVALNANNAVLSDLGITRTSPPDAVGFQPFTLSNLGAGATMQTVTIGDAPSNLTLEVNSPSALNFSLAHNGQANRGITLAGGGIVTSGGNVTLSTNNGPINATTGGITTGGPDGGGNVDLRTSGGASGINIITTGAIDTRPTGVGDSGSIFVQTNCASCNINVDGNLTAGDDADTAANITLNVNTSGSITGAGTITSASPGSVRVFTNNGDIGAMGAPLSIVSPTVNLEARGGAGNGIGTVFADLTGAGVLTLRGDNGFDVSSTVPFTTLSVATRGTGLGPLDLTAPTQTYAFNRPDANTFQVLTAAGAAPGDLPPASSTFIAQDGDLLIAGGAMLTSPTLDLRAATFNGNIRLDGTAAPLELSNETQRIGVSGAQDILITGDVTIAADVQQNFQATRNITAQAQGGPISIEAPSQSFFVSGNGAISFLGGAGADESVTVMASQSQSISTFDGGAVRHLNLTAGAGDRSSVSVLYTGTGTQFVDMGTNINITGGAMGSTDAFAEIRATAGAQRIRARGSINVTGGQGTNGDARIVNTSGNSQQVGESFCCSYQTAAINLTGGKAESSAEITAAGLQRIRSTGIVTLRGGDGNNSRARIESTSAQTQELGAGSFNRLGGLDMEGGTGQGASVEILATGSQEINVNNTTRVVGGGATGAHALIRSSAANSQTLRTGDFIVAGGTEENTFGRVTTPGTQNIFYSTATLTGGTAMGTFALVDAGGNQTLSGGDITLTAAGVPPVGVPAGNAGAAFRGHSQTVNAGALMINAGAGLDGSPSDAGFWNMSGDQTFNVGLIDINGGIQHSRGGIFNPAGAGTQFISAPNGISLTGAAAGPGADVLIDNAAMTMQTVQATGGAVILSNVGGGLVGITGAEKQAITASAIEVLTSAMSTATAHSTIFAPDTQYLRTTDAAGPLDTASVYVAALGPGRADIRSNSTQLIEADYFEVGTGVDRVGSIVIGDANGMGTSLIHGQNQHIFARTLTIQGPAAGTMSKLTGVDVQSISILDGVIDVLGGSGANSVAGIDPTIQAIVANGGLGVLGGSAANATGAIVSTGPQQIYVTRGDATVQAGTENGTAASVQAAGDQVFAAAGLLTVAGSAAGTSAAARIFTTAGSQTVNFGSLVLAANAGSAADITSPGTQTLNGGAVTMASNTPNGAALIQSAGDQTVNVGAITMAGGANPNAVSRIMSGGAQAITFNGLTMNAGAGAGSFVKIDSSGGQTLTGGGGAVALTASAGGTATIEGHSQTVTCAGCSLTLTGNSGARLLNLSGAQAVVAGLIRLFGGQASTTGIQNQGTDAQSVTATAGEILLESHPNAAASGRVVIENVPGTAQTVNAMQDISLVSRGGGTVAVTSGGTQSIDARGLDVQTATSTPGGANATVQAAADQTIHTTGSLAAESGVGMRVASRSTGTAKVESAGNQTINVDGNQLLIGRLSFGPPGPGNSTAGNPAVGDSLVQATSLLADPNQTVTAGSVYVQGPSTDFRISKLSGDGTQVVTASPPTGYISLVGGSGTDAFAVIDPTNQTVTSAGNMLLQGGSGPNADALINATGPQTVLSQNGSIALNGGIGQGADALIVTTSPFQTVSAPNGAVTLTPGPTGGGIAGLQQGSNLEPAQLGSSLVTGDILREQEELEELREDVSDASGQQTEGSAQETQVPLCT